MPSENSRPSVRSGPEPQRPAQAASFSCLLPRGIRHGWLAFLSFGIALLFLTATGASAETALQTWSVNTLSDSSDSACTTFNNCSLREAILAADNAGGISLIEFAPGLVGTITLNPAYGPLNVSSRIAIKGPGANQLTVSGNHAVEIFNVTASLSISGLAIADAGLGTAGAMTFYSNNPNDHLVVTNCTFYGNSTNDAGGAIFDKSVGTLRITRSTFYDNLAGTGGAIFSYGPLFVTESTFNHNSATGDGGAVFSYSSGGLTVTNTTFSNNHSANQGGALIIEGGSLTVNNNTFSGNSAAHGGGAILVANVNFIRQITNNIFAHNSGGLAPGSCGAICSKVGNFEESNNLFYNNHNGDVSGFSLSATDITGKNPNLLPLDNFGGPTETRMPWPGSPAICAGSASAVPGKTTTDQRGFPISPTVGACGNGGVDIGSVQTNYLLVTNASGTGPGTLPGAVALAETQPYTDIGFAPGLPTITLSDSLYLDNGETVIVGPPNAVTISGGGNTNILTTDDSPTVILFALSFTGGNNSEGGGAIDLRKGNATLIVSGCTFYKNGSISTNGSRGGAIALDNGGTLVVTESTFYDNSSGSSQVVGAGGAIFVRNGTLTVSSSTFDKNTAQAGFGGAIWNNSGTPIVTNSIFSDNMAQNGGGIAAMSGTIVNESNLFYNNTGGDLYTGGVYELPSKVDIAGDPKLGPLASYGGPTETMLPTPGSAAICAGTVDLPSPLVLPSTDQRGFSRVNTRYSGFSASQPCLDIGAVQTDYQSIQFTNGANGYSAIVNQDAAPAPNVSVTENGQNIGGVSVELSLASFFTASGSYTATGLGPVTTIANQGATFPNLAVNTSGTGQLSATLELFTPKGASEPVTITTDPTATLTILTPLQATLSLIRYVKTLRPRVLNDGQDSSLVTELTEVSHMISGGNIQGAIGILEGFVYEVKGLYRSGVLNQTEENTMITDANNIIKALESQ